MDKWRLIHRYNRLVEIGEAKPFTCPDCGERLVTIPDTETEPVLYCAFDDHAFMPGSAFWSDVKAVVTEFYVES